VERWFKRDYLGKHMQAPLTLSLDRCSLSVQSYEVHPRDSFSLSPRYQSPTVSSSRIHDRSESPIGCSVCGPHSLPVVKSSVPDSPPRILPHNKPVISHSSLPDSAAFARIVRTDVREAGGESVDSVMSDALKIVDWKVLETAERQEMPEIPMAEFNLSQCESATRIQTTVLEEVCPAPPLALTPMNFQEARAVKSSLLYNKAAKQFVHEDERKRVSIRRAEYANRTKGFVRTVQCTSRRSTKPMSSQDSLEDIWDKKMLVQQKMSDIKAKAKASVPSHVVSTKTAAYKAFKPRAGRTTSVIAQMLKDEATKRTAKTPVPFEDPKDTDSLEGDWKPLTEQDEVPIDLEPLVFLATPVKRAQSCDMPSSQKSKSHHTRQSPLLEEYFPVPVSHDSDESTPVQNQQTTQTDSYQLLKVAVTSMQTFFELAGEMRVRAAFEQLEKYKQWTRELPFKELLGV